MGKLLKSQTRHCIMVSILTMMLSACSFHFRGNEGGSNNNALKELNVKGINRFTDIATDVKKLAQNQGILITPKAKWSITISDEKLDRWQASTSQSVATNEYYLHLSAILNVHHADITYRDIPVSAESLFQDNANLSSSKANEQNIIVSELRHKMAEDILSRVQFLASNPPDCDDNESKPTTTP